MAPSAYRPSLGRRVVLVLDCLEDRTTPATLNMFGQTVTEMIPARIDLDASAVGRFAVAAPMPAFAVIHAPGPDEVPFGFFHPFSQNGFGVSDPVAEAAPLPQPRPVTPPLDPAQVLPDPELPAIPLPAAPRADNDVPAPALEAPPPFEAPPPLIRSPRSELPPPPQAQPLPVQVTESAPDTDAAVEAAVTSAGNGSRNSFAAVGVLTAAFSLMYARNSRERRYDDALTFGH